MATEKWTFGAIAMAVAVLIVEVVKGAQLLSALAIIVAAAVLSVAVGGLLGAIELYLRGRAHSSDSES